eukprot:tig00001222_g7600.t1
MATSSSEGDEGGWPSELFEPGEEAKAEGLELTCAVCCLVMREPTLLGCSNDHALCRTCAERLAREAGYPFEYEYMRAQLKCPIDRDVVDRERFRPAPFISRRVNALKVHCSFQERGCEWRGDLGSLADHAERCAAGWGVCGGCGARVPVDDLPAHEAACRRPCPNAELGCTARLADSELEAHLGRCLRDLVARLARDKTALEGRVDDLSVQLEAMRQRLDPEATSPAAASSRGAAAVAAGGAQAARAGQGPGELRVAPRQSIMAAVRRALPGQTIRLAPGVYREQVVLDKEVHIVGPREAILEWNNGCGVALLCTRPAAPSVQGITIRNTGSSSVAVQFSDGSRAVVEDCNVSSAGVGIEVRGEGTAPTLRDNAVHGCGFGGIYLHDSAEGVAEENDVYGNGGTGIAIWGRADPVVRGNRIHDQPHGIRVFRGGRSTIEWNWFDRISDPSYAPGGVKVEDGCTPVVRGNAFRA